MSDARHLFPKLEKYKLSYWDKNDKGNLVLVLVFIFLSNEKNKGDNMVKFKFDIDKTADENIDSFFSVLKLIDEEMADLLRSNIGKMIPLPDDSHQRTNARVSFNQAIINRLEKMNKLRGTES